MAPHSAYVTDLESALDRACASAGAFVAIRGPAGIGKTTMLDALGRVALARGVRHLAAAGTSLTQQLPYSGVRDLFGPVIRSDDPPLNGAATLALPALALGGAPASRASALHGLTWLALDLAARGPVLMTLDDIHHLDAETMDWLSYLRPRIEGTRLLAVIAGRAESPGSPAHTLMGSIPPSRIIEPRPFDVHQIATLATRAGHLLSASDIETIHATTGGLPFLVRAVLDGRPLLDRPGAPDALPAAVLSRIAPTGSYAVSVAQTMAVLGSDADVTTIAHLTGLLATQVVAVLEDLRHARLVDGPPLRFVHSLIEDSVLNSTSASDRHALHVGAAEVLARRGVEDDRLAGHLLQAFPTGEPRHADWLQRAAESAIARGAPTTAASYLHRLLEEPLTDAARSHAHHLLGVCGVQTGDAQAVRHLGLAASRDPTPAGRVSAGVDLMKALISEGRMAEAYAGAMARISGEDPGSDLGRQFRADALGLAQMHLAQPAEIDALARALEPTLTYDGSLTDRRVAGALSYDHFRRGLPARQCLALASYALEGAMDVPIDLALSPALIVAQVALAFSGGASALRELAIGGQRWASGHGAPALFFRCGWMEALAATYQGDLLCVERVCEETLRAFDDGLVALPAVASALAFDVAGMVERGDADGARQALATVGLLDAEPGTVGSAGLLGARGLLELRAGDAQRAYDDFHAAGELQTRTGHETTAAVPWRTWAIEALVALGRHEAAAQLAEDEVAAARAFAEPRMLGMALTARSRTHADPLPDLAEAIEVLAESGASLEHARALVLRGVALRRRGARSESRVPLRIGRDLASRCGARPLATLAEDELRASGAYLVSRPASGVASLTASERRVAVQAAAGLTNSQIAQQFFLSLKTIEMHLSRSYQKLGIHGRDELRAALEEV